MKVYSELKTLQKSALEDDYIVYYFYRRFSIFFSWFFVKIKASANFVTFFSLIADFFVVYLMSIGQFILAGIFVNLAIILDCSDGEVARFYRLYNKDKPKKHYGGYLDETLGTIGFTLVVFFAGYFMGNIWLGLFAMFGLFMVIVSSAISEIEFPEKKEIVKKFENSLIGNIKGRIGFSNGIQRLLVSIAVIFSSIYLLGLFAILANLFWILKYWVYRKY